MKRFTLALCLLLPVSSAVLLPAAARADDECRHRAERAAEAPTDGIRQVIVKAGAGSLEIKGEPGRQRMQARGEACASDEDQLERLQIRVERKGDTLVISSITSEVELAPRRWFGSHARLDVVIKVPANVALDVEDGSGDTTISNVGAVKISDGSGSLHIEGITGSVELDDGSGEVTITRVRGPLNIKDGSGEIEIKQITGEVTIVNDGSGGLAMLDIQGDVTIINDGSGDILIERVSGSVKIEEDGSGAINVSRVKRDVAVDRDGSGEIVVRDVDGRLSIGNHGSGGVRHERIGGGITLRND